MIEIRPTTESGLSHSVFTVQLPGQINPIRPRSQKITTVLSGGAAVTFWARNNQGAQQTQEVTIPQSKLAILLLIANHASVFEWLVFCDGRRYVCGIDIDSPVDVAIGGTYYKRLNVSFTVVREF